MAITIEDVLDKISNKLIENINDIGNDLGYNVVRASQKVIRGGKLIVAGGTVIEPGERLVLFDQDTLANSEDDLLALENKLVEEYGSTWYDATIDQIDIEVKNLGGNANFGGWQILLNNQVITDIIVNIDGNNNNPINVGQFIDFDETTVTIDSDQAQEFLDTNIFELLPIGDTKQQRINKFFQEYQELKGGIPLFDTDGDGIVDGSFNPETYSEGHDISAAQDTPVDGTDPPGIAEEDSSITRLNADANTQNTSKTLQYLRDDLNTFLRDVDEQLDFELEEGRPEYENKSDGYLKIRNLNQGIVVRKQEGDDIGVENIVINSVCGGGGGPSYLCEGFTISIWVRFLDTTSKGTLFNYGNPFRGIDPKGFKLETFVLNKNDKPSAGSGAGSTWGDLMTDYFTDNDSERFVRLVVRDHTDNNYLYDSHLGMAGFERTNMTNFVPEFGGTSTTNYDDGDETYLITHTRIPIDFNEWFFIVASFNPSTVDGPAAGPAGYEINPDYWTGNVNMSGEYVANSGLGSKCKVEVISKSDLLRARGYRV